MPRTFRYDFNWRRCRFMMLLWSISFNFFTYFSMIFKSEAEATLFVVMKMPLLSVQIKSIEIVNLTLFKSLLIFVAWALALAITLLELLDPIETMICFQNGPFIVILIFGLSFLTKLFMIFWISKTLFANSLGIASLIFMISLMSSLKACI